ncbi:hypothetical protein E2C01_007131 [Portunus trituberculatus]|uniref:Uncharacterized protein n=1 Tax=Portunus trituberculatus TaxID=210409 RepID=A0A5B7D1J9_PORTR|nr:hypothetical protein [Portunus trituberculatus]
MTDITSDYQYNSDLSQEQRCTIWIQSLSMIVQNGPAMVSTNAMHGTSTDANLPTKTSSSSASPKRVSVAEEPPCFFIQYSAVHHLLMCMFLFYLAFEDLWLY